MALTLEQIKSAAKAGAEEAIAAHKCEYEKEWPHTKEANAQTWENKESIIKMQTEKTTAIWLIGLNGS